MRWRSRKDYRERRHKRIRGSIAGTAERPRMSIMISNKHMYVQFVDDDKGITLASVSNAGETKNNVAAAKELGTRAAAAAVAKGVKMVVVDRGGHLFHGKVKAIVDAAVQAGVQISSKEEK